MPLIDNLKDFNFEEASVSLWVFKGPNGPASEDPDYTGRWVEITDDVDEILKETASSEIDRIEEVHQYGLLVENHQTSALNITKNETHAGYIVDESADETQAKKVTQLKHLQNTKFYVAKFVHNQSVLHAVTRVGQNWATKKARSKRTLYFTENRLDLDERPHFDIQKKIDFFVFENDILCLNKGNFESVLRYKQAHKEDFEALQAEPDFSGAFVDLQPLIDFVGNNKIQLRRASAIRQKGHYKDGDFMDRLRAHQANYGLSIQFDDQGKIVATEGTCSEIMTALLDHRLASGFSEMVYDVPSSKPVNV